MSRPVPNPGILEIAPYTPGKSPVPEPGRKVFKLSANETPLGPSPKAIAAYRNAAGHLEDYPEGTSRVLREAIGRAFGLDPDRIICGAGSDEILNLLAHTYLKHGDEAISTAHGFLVYPIATMANGAINVVAPEKEFTADVDAILARVSPRTKLVWLANPNNPTGTYLPFDEVKRLRAGLPGDVLLVLDAAYSDYVSRNDYEIGIELVATTENTVMTHTFSKIHGLASLRIGIFGRNGEPILTATGEVAQNRDRTSIALLNQLSGQYIGRFFDQRLRVEVGVRSPWFKRKLDQHCYTPVTSNFPDCYENPLALGYRIVPPTFNPANANPDNKDLWAPFKATYKYHKILPNVGFTYALNNSLSAFASYAKGLSAPRTDNLYRAPIIDVKPETTDSFDLGARYITGRFQAQATAWYIGYQNRIVTTFDPELNISVDRNVGKAKSWGVDTGLGFKPVRGVNLIGLLSYTNAKLKDDVLIGTVRYTVGTGPQTPLTPFQYLCSTLPTTGSANVNVCGRTAGKFIVETPKWQYGGRAEFHFEPMTVGVQAKHVGDRWATDVNDVKSKGYTTVDLDARIKLPFPGTRSQFQLNVTNLLGEHYFGNLSTQINAFGPGSVAPRFTPGASRAVTGTLTFGL